jgi:hypothetical protein
VVANLASSTWPSSTPGIPPTQAVALGLGSLFNHSTLHQNVGWQRRTHEEVIVYTALKDIGRDEELCISYGGPEVLWFPDADAEQVREAQHSEHQQQMKAASESGILGSSGLVNIDLSAD